MHPRRLACLRWEVDWTVCPWMPVSIPRQKDECALSEEVSQTSGGVVNKKKSTNTRLRAILIVIVAGKTFYLDCRRSHGKQADAGIIRSDWEKMRCRVGAYWSQKGKASSLSFPMPARFLFCGAV